MVVTRFAPSPTGPLHLGSAYAAWFAWRAARDAGGRFLLRIEDLDQGRARPEYEQGIMDDLRWLGLDWDGAIVRQSERTEAYIDALERLEALGVVYPCFCTRRDITEQIASAPHDLTPDGPDGPIYPGTCRHLPKDEAASRIANGKAPALRLDVARAMAISGPIQWREAARVVEACPEAFGDIVLSRKDAPAAYHLAVVVDDAASGITLVTRGVDLAPATDVQALLQRLLGLPAPEYRHHRLVTGPGGARLAKRDRSSSVAERRQAGESPDAVLSAAEAS